MKHIHFCRKIALKLPIFPRISCVFLRFQHNVNEIKTHQTSAYDFFPDVQHCKSFEKVIKIGGGAPLVDECIHSSLRLNHSLKSTQMALEWKIHNMLPNFRHSHVTTEQIWYFLELVRVRQCLIGFVTFIWIG